MFENLIRYVVRVRGPTYVMLTQAIIQKKEINQCYAVFCYPGPTNSTAYNQVSIFSPAYTDYGFWTYQLEPTQVTGLIPPTAYLCSL